MAKRTRLTYEDELRRRQRRLFVGRDEERRVFQQNLGSDLPEFLIFAIYGQAGIGKSFLLSRYQDIAREKGALTALTTEAEATAVQDASIVGAMGRLAAEMAEAGKPLKGFEKGYQRYQACMRTIEADKHAPQGLFDRAARALTRAALSAADKTLVGPIVNGMQEVVGKDQDDLVHEAGAWATYVATKFRNKADVALLTKPVETLTPLFVQHLNRLAEDRRVVLCFDSWECTGDHLSEWVRGLLRRGGLSANVWLTIAGRNRLGDEWESLQSLMACFELNEFSEEETRDYLKRQGIADEERAQQIVDFARGIPVLVSTLASAKGGSTTEAAHDLVDRYLKWVDDPRRQEAALHCAAARRLDRDVVTAVVGGEEAGALFDWLSDMPFVQSRPGYWEYHPTVRRLMLEYMRSRSEKESSEVHRRLRAYHQETMPGGEDRDLYRDEEWRRHALEWLYHGLMGQCDEAMREGLELFLLALSRYYQLAGKVAATWGQVAQELAATGEKARWGSVIRGLWQALHTHSWRDALPACEVLIRRVDLGAAAMSVVHLTVGRVHDRLGNCEQAVAGYSEAIRLDPEGVPAYLNRGTVYDDLGESERAIADYSEAIRLDPAFAAAYSNRGGTYSKLGEYERAIADCNEAIRLDPGLAVPYYIRASTYDELDEHERAIADYSEAIRLDPEDAAAYYTMRGNAYRGKGEYERAIADCSEAIRLDPGLAGAYANRGIALWDKGEYERAIADLNEAIRLDSGLAAAYHNRGAAFEHKGECERAIANYDAAIRLDPGLAAGYFGRGNAYRGKGEYERAIADYGEAIRLDPGLAAAYANRGAACSKLGDYERAVADYSEAIRLDPGLVAAYYIRGDAYNDLGEYERAIADYSEAIRLDPEDAAAYTSRGNAYSGKGAYERAVADYNEAIRLDPGLAAAYANRGSAYHDLGEYERAIADYDAAIRLDPGLATAYSNRGAAFEQKGEYERAIVDCSEAIRLAPRFAAAYLVRGCAYDDLAEYERAVADYNEAIRLNHEDAAAYSNRGMACSKLGDYERAAADYSEAIRLDPGRAPAHYNMACVYGLMGDAGQACSWLDKAIELDESCRADATEDKDFDPIRGDKRLQTLIGKDEGAGEG